MAAPEQSFPLYPAQLVSPPLIGQSSFEVEGTWSTPCRCVGSSHWANHFQPAQQELRLRSHACQGQGPLYPPLYFAWNILFKSRAVRAMFWDVKNISSDIFSPFQSECCADWLLKMSNLHERHFIFNLNLSSAAFWWQRREKSTISRSPIDALMLHIWNIAKGTTDPRVDHLNKIQLG